MSTDLYPSEEQEQEQIFQWMRIAQGAEPDLGMLYAIPNGGFRTPATAARLKATGVRAGVPDMCLPVPRGKYHGLYIELKKKKGGTVSAAQKSWLLMLERQGYKCSVCHGAEAAIDLIKAYLEGKA